MNLDKNLEEIKPEKVLDTRGLISPMPVLKTMHALGSLSIGKTLEVWCSDPDFQCDFNELCEKECTLILGTIDDPDGHVRYFIQKIMKRVHP
jgi:TusA-related sulfurtransferase